MPRIFLIAGVLGLGLMNFSHYQGWSLFAEDSQAQPVRSANAARALYHK
jgi:hypothetical protein